MTITLAQRQDMLSKLYHAYLSQQAAGVGPELQPNMDAVQRQIRALPLEGDPVPPVPPTPPPTVPLPVDLESRVEAPTKRIDVLPALGRILAIPVLIPAGPFDLSPNMTLAMTEKTGSSEGALRAACIADTAGDMANLHTPGKCSQGRAVAIDLAVTAADAGRAIFFNVAYLADIDPTVGQPAGPMLSTFDVIWPH